MTKNTTVFRIHAFHTAANALYEIVKNLWGLPGLGALGNQWDLNLWRMQPISGGIYWTHVTMDIKSPVMIFYSKDGYTVVAHWGPNPGQEKVFYELDIHFL